MEEMYFNGPLLPQASRASGSGMSQDRSVAVVRAGSTSGVAPTGFTFHKSFNRSLSVATSTTERSIAEGSVAVLPLGSSSGVGGRMPSGFSFNKQSKRSLSVATAATEGPERSEHVSWWCSIDQETN
jgi:hypothetical protein